MDDATLKELKAALISERDRLADEIAALERDSAEALADTSGENNYRDHMADQGSATFGKELDMSLEDNARDLHGMVVRALERVGEGTYGKCVRCGAEIATERLKVMPSADLCVTCKVWQERG